MDADRRGATRNQNRRQQGKKNAIHGAARTCSDSRRNQLLKHRKPIETTLSDKTRDLFSLKRSVILLRRHQHAFRRRLRDFHQLEERVEGHIFISVLAYHLLCWNGRLGSAF